MAAFLVFNYRNLAKELALPMHMIFVTYDCLYDFYLILLPLLSLYLDNKPHFIDIRHKFIAICIRIFIINTVMSDNGHNDLN